MSRKSERVRTCSEGLAFATMANIAKCTQAETPNPNKMPKDNRSHDKRKYDAKRNKNRMSPDSMTKTVCSRRWNPEIKNLGLSPWAKPAMTPASKTSADPNTLTATLLTRLTEGYCVKTLAKISPMTRNFKRLSRRRLAQSMRQKFGAETNGAKS